MRKQANSFSLKLKNFTWRDNDVKALDSTKPSLRTAVRNEFKSTADQWSDRFRNEDGNMWVNDGKTVPVAFGDNFSIEISYGFGGTPYTYTQIIVDKTTFIQAAKEISEGIYIQSGVTDDWGMDVRYLGSNLYVNFNVFEDDGEVWGSFMNTTMGFTLSKNTYNEDVIDSGVEGTLTNTPIKPEIIGNDTYGAVVSSILEEPLLVNGLEVYSEDSAQLMSPLSFKQYDVNGNESVITSSPVIDPYQAQNILKYKFDLDFGGQTVVSAQVNGDSETMITFDYKDKARFERKITLDGEGMLTHQEDALHEYERETYEEVYANFSGFDKDKNKLTKLIIVGLIAYILIKN